jgi:hypothetical protein
MGYFLADFFANPSGHPGFQAACSLSGNKKSQFSFVVFASGLSGLKQQTFEKPTKRRITDNFHLPKQTYLRKNA